VRRTFLVFAAAPPGISCTGSRAFSIAIRAGILWDRRRRCRDLWTGGIRVRVSKTVGNLAGGCRCWTRRTARPAPDAAV